MSSAQAHTQQLSDGAGDDPQSTTLSKVKWSPIGKDETRLIHDQVEDLLKSRYRAYDLQYKVCVLGPAASGKTSLVRTLTGNIGDFESYVPTKGAEFSHWDVNIGKKRMVRLSIWDCAGAPEFANMLSSWIYDAVVALVVFDVTSEKSFQEAQVLVDVLQQTVVASHLNIILVANKIDVPKSKTLTTIATVPSTCENPTTSDPSANGQNPGEDTVDKPIPIMNVSDPALHVSRDSRYKIERHEEPSGRIIKVSEGVRVARKVGIKYFEVSAKTAKHVFALFHHIARFSYLEQVNLARFDRISLTGVAQSGDVLSKRGKPQKAPQGTQRRSSRLGAASTLGILNSDFTQPLVIRGVRSRRKSTVTSPHFPGMLFRPTLTTTQSAIRGSSAKQLALLLYQSRPDYLGLLQVAPAKSTGRTSVSSTSNKNGVNRNAAATTGIESSPQEVSTNDAESSLTRKRGSVASQHTPELDRGLSEFLIVSHESPAMTTMTNEVSEATQGGYIAKERYDLEDDMMLSARVDADDEDDDTTQSSDDDVSDYDDDADDDNDDGADDEPQLGDGEYIHGDDTVDSFQSWSDAHASDMSISDGFREFDYDVLDAEGKPISGSVPIGTLRDSGLFPHNTTFRDGDDSEQEVDLKGLDEGIQREKLAHAGTRFDSHSISTCRASESMDDLKEFTEGATLSDTTAHRRLSAHSSLEAPALETQSTVPQQHHHNQSQRKEEDVVEVLTAEIEMPAISDGGQSHRSPLEVSLIPDGSASNVILSPGFPAVSSPEPALLLSSGGELMLSSPRLGPSHLAQPLTPGRKGTEASATDSRDEMAFDEAAVLNSLDNPERDDVILTFDAGDSSNARHTIPDKATATHSRLKQHHSLETIDEGTTRGQSFDLVVQREPHQTQRASTEDTSPKPVGPSAQLIQPGTPTVVEMTTEDLSTLTNQTTPQAKPPSVTLPTRGSLGRKTVSRRTSENNPRPVIVHQHLEPHPSEASQPTGHSVQPTNAKSKSRANRFFLDLARIPLGAILATLCLLLVGIPSYLVRYMLPISHVEFTTKDVVNAFERPVEARRNRYKIRYAYILAAAIPFLFVLYAWPAICTFAIVSEESIAPQDIESAMGTGLIVLSCFLVLLCFLAIRYSRLHGTAADSSRLSIPDLYVKAMNDLERARETPRVNYGAGVVHGSRYAASPLVGTTRTASATFSAGSAKFTRIHSYAGTPATVTEPLKPIVALYRVGSNGSAGSGSTRCTDSPVLGPLSSGIQADSGRENAAGQQSQPQEEGRPAQEVYGEQYVEQAPELTELVPELRIALHQRHEQMMNLQDVYYSAAGLPIDSIGYTPPQLSIFRNSAYSGYLRAVGTDVFNSRHGILANAAAHLSQGGFALTTDSPGEASSVASAENFSLVASRAEQSLPPPQITWTSDPRESKAVTDLPPNDVWKSKGLSSTLAVPSDSTQAGGSTPIGRTSLARTRSYNMSFMAQLDPTPVDSMVVTPVPKVTVAGKPMPSPLVLATAPSYGRDVFTPKSRNSGIFASYSGPVVPDPESFARLALPSSPTPNSEPPELSRARDALINEARYPRAQWRWFWRCCYRDEHLREFDTLNQVNRDSKSSGGPDSTEPRRWAAWPGSAAGPGIWVTLLMAIELVQWIFLPLGQHAPEWVVKVHRAVFLIHNSNIMGWVSIGLVAVMIIALAVQVCLDITNYLHIKDRRRAEQRLFFALTGSFLFGHVRIDRISPGVRRVLFFVCDSCFLLVTFHLLNSISCTYYPDAAYTFIDPEVSCWTSQGSGYGILALIAVQIYILVSVVLVPNVVLAGGLLRQERYKRSAKGAILRFITQYLKCMHPSFMHASFHQGTQGLAMTRSLSYAPGAYDELALLHQSQAGDTVVNLGLPHDGLITYHNENIKNDWHLSASNIVGVTFHHKYLMMQYSVKCILLTGYIVIFREFSHGEVFLVVGSFALALLTIIWMKYPQTMRISPFKDESATTQLGAEGRTSTINIGTTAPIASPMSTVNHQFAKLTQVDREVLKEVSSDLKRLIQLSEENTQRYMPSSSRLVDYFKISTFLLGSWSALTSAVLRNSQNSSSDPHQRWLIMWLAGICWIIIMVTLVFHRVAIAQWVERQGGFRMSLYSLFFGCVPCCSRTKPDSSHPDSPHPESPHPESLRAADLSLEVDVDGASRPKKQSTLFSRLCSACCSKHSREDLDVELSHFSMPRPLPARSSGPQSPPAPQALMISVSPSGQHDVASSSSHPVDEKSVAESTTAPVGAEQDGTQSDTRTPRASARAPIISPTAVVDTHPKQRPRIEGYGYTMVPPSLPESSSRFNFHRQSAQRSTDPAAPRVRSFDEEMSQLMDQIADLERSLNSTVERISQQRLAAPLHRFGYTSSSASSGTRLTYSRETISIAAAGSASKDVDGKLQPFGFSSRLYAKHAGSSSSNASEFTDFAKEMTSRLINISKDGQAAKKLVNQLLQDEEREALDRNERQAQRATQHLLSKSNLAKRAAERSEVLLRAQRYMAYLRTLEMKRQAALWNTPLLRGCQYIRAEYLAKYPHKCIKITVESETTLVLPDGTVYARLQGISSVAQALERLSQLTTPQSRDLSTQAPETKEIPVASVSPAPSSASTERVLLNTGEAKTIEGDAVQLPSVGSSAATVLKPGSRIIVVSRRIRKETYVCCEWCDKFARVQFNANFYPDLAFGQPPNSHHPAVLYFQRKSKQKGALRKQWRG